MSGLVCSSSFPESATQSVSRFFHCVAGITPVNFSSRTRLDPGSPARFRFFRSPISLRALLPGSCFFSRIAQPFRFHPFLPLVPQLTVSRTVLATHCFFCSLVGRVLSACFPGYRLSSAWMTAPPKMPQMALGLVSCGWPCGLYRFTSVYVRNSRTLDGSSLRRKTFREYMWRIDSAHSRLSL